MTLASGHRIRWRVPTFSGEGVQRSPGADMALERNKVADCFLT
jgi:hypothetical protein